MQHALDVESQYRMYGAYFMLRFAVPVPGMRCIVWEECKRKYGLSRQKEHTEIEMQFLIRPESFPHPCLPHHYC